jgi:hypothetical protein
MTILKQDITYALRQFQRNPGFVLATVLTLALGIGANTAIFSVVNRVLLRPLPYKNGSRLVHIGYRPGTSGSETMKFSIPDLVDLREQDRTFEGISEYHSMPFTLLGRGEPDRVRSGVVSAGFFEDLGVEPLVGRTFRSGDDQPGAAPVLVLAYSYWQSRFGGDTAIVGQTLKLNGRPVTVIGVLPSLPPYPGKDDMYIPISVSPFRSNGMVLHDRSFKALSLFGRLKKGVTLPEAQASINTVSARSRKS